MVLLIITPVSKGNISTVGKLERGKFFFGSESEQSSIIILANSVLSGSAINPLFAENPDFWRRIR